MLAGMREGEPRESALPWVARTLMPREVGTHAFMAVALGALEGGLVGVIVKTRFEAVAEPALVNLAVALVTGAPALANLAAVSIAGLTQGRDKPRWVAALMALTSIGLLGIAAAPVTAAGLVLLTLSMIAGRVAWAGVVTLRSAIWRANFPRHVRARVTGRVTVTFSVIMAACAGAIGLAMDPWPGVYRIAFPVAGALGLVAASRYRSTRLRQAERLRRDELLARQEAPPSRLGATWGILRHDVWYRRYMLTMFLFGSGNLMVIALLVIILNEQFDFPRFRQVLVTTTLPLTTVALFTPWWARRLDRHHILDYRARHSWMFAFALGAFALAASTGVVALFWVGSLGLGAAFAGGQLGWNLGHNDFAPDGRATLYMGVHLTLTGLRGLIAPVVGVLAYQWLEGLEPGAGRHVLFFPFALTVAGAVTFVVLARLRRRA